MRNNILQITALVVGLAFISILANAYTGFATAGKPTPEIFEIGQYEPVAQSLKQMPNDNAALLAILAIAAVGVLKENERHSRKRRS